MALTTDQAQLLQDTIENLNRSIAINEQVLEICRSVGNTGAVDISIHNTDPNAHRNFKNVFASDGFVIGNSYIDERAYSSFTRKINTAQTVGNIFLDAYTCMGSTDHESDATGFALRHVYYVNDWNKFTTTSPTFDIASFSSRIGYKQDGSQSISFSTTHTLSYAIKDGKNYAYLGISSDSGVASQFYFEVDQFRPNNPRDLGTSAFQWKDCYLQNSPIVSSDRRLKQDISEIPEAAFRAWGRVNFKQYRFKDAVAKKGSAARLHVGVIAQEIIEAFKAEGLDATAYGIVCHDEWTDQYETTQVIDAEAVYGEDGKIVTPEKSHTETRLVKQAGDVWTVRYEELLSFDAAYQHWRLSKIEAALKLKGITL